MHADAWLDPAGRGRRRATRPAARRARDARPRMRRRCSRHSPASRHSSRPGSSAAPMRRARSALARRRSSRRCADSTCPMPPAARRPARGRAGPRRGVPLAVGRVHDGPAQRSRSDLVSEGGTTSAVARLGRARSRRRRPPTARRGRRSTRRPSARRSPRSWTPSCRWSRSSTSGSSAASSGRRRHRIRVELLPTFVGCPALELIRHAVAERLAASPRPRTVEVVATFEVPWTSERISPAGRRRPGGRRDRAADRRAATHRPLSVLRLDGPVMWTTPSARPSAGPSATAATAASRSKRSSRSDRGRLAGGPVGIVGAGTMGAGIAQLALEAGHEVVLHDVDPAAIERGRGRIRTGLERRAAPARSRPGLGRRLGRRAGSTACARSPTPRRLAGADLVIEAAARGPRGQARRSSRRSTRATRADAILATNTSALSVGAIARATARPERVLGLHFFNPAPVMPLVEVVAAPATDPAVVERATALMTAWGKVAVRCRGHAGLHRQPGQPAVHARGAADARGRRRRRRGDRRRDARRRLPDGPVRAHGPRSGSTSTSRPRRASGSASAGPTALPPVADPGAPRRRRAARPQDRARASTATRTGARGRAAHRTSAGEDGAPVSRARDRRADPRRSSTRPTGPSARASPPRPTSTWRCASAPGTRMGPFERAR